MTIREYNGQNESVLDTPLRSRFAAGGRATLPTYKPIPESVLRRPNDFWARVAVDIVADENACYPWRGRIDAEGYGRTGRNLYAHRVAFTLAKGPIPYGLTIDHLCQNRRCCNPAHLDAVTISENLRRRKESTTQPTGKYRPRKRTAARYSRRRERGMCVQCNTPSDKYRCDPCRVRHNELDKLRRRLCSRETPP